MAHLVFQQKKLASILVPKIAYQAKWTALLGAAAGIVSYSLEGGMHAVCVAGCGGSKGAMVEFGDRIRAAFSCRGQCIKVPAAEFEVVGFATDISVNFNDSRACQQWQHARAPMPIAA